MTIDVNFSERSKLFKYLSSKLIGFPKEENNYNNFFNGYAKENYKWEANNCLCKSSDDLLISRIDRHNVPFQVVICKSCGLIRAKEYLRNEDVIHFYKNIYRTKLYAKSTHTANPEKLFNKQLRTTRHAFSLIKQHLIKKENLKIVDVGGGVGGILTFFEKNNELYLCDFFKPYLDFAKKKKLKIIDGGLEKVDFKPDIIILSHVVEHWNNFEEEIEKLIKIQKKNETLNYIEFPGVDSLQKGRRQGDILGDIHIPHVFYFQTKVFENLMNRYGFEKVYMDTFIRSIFIYTGRKKTLINYFQNVCDDLIAGEKFKKKQIFKNFLKIFIPNLILNQIRKIKDNSIKY